MTIKDKGKAAITAIEYSAPNRTMLFSPGKSNLQVDVRWGEQANIKGEASNSERRLGKKVKNQSLPDRLEEKDSLSEYGLILYEHHV